MDPSQIARDLKATVILTGRVIRQGDKLNVQTELIDVTENSQLWGEQYDRPAAEALTLQRDITRAVAKKLGVATGDSDAALMSRSDTSNPTAYQLYLQGRHQWALRTPESLEQAIALFREAVSLDPKYAAAYAGLADSYNLQADYGGKPPSDVFPLAKTAIETALSLDPNSAEIYTSIASIRDGYDWDRESAEAAYVRATQLDPQYVTAHHWLGLHFTSLRKFDEAHRELQRALELEPFSPKIMTDIATLDVYSGHYDAAIQMTNRVLTANPDYSAARTVQGWAEERKGNFDAALRTFEALPPDEKLPLIAHVEASRSNASARNLVKDLERAPRNVVSAYSVAQVFALLRDESAALAWLKRARDAHDPGLMWLGVDSEFDGMRRNVEFRAIAKSVGL